MTISQRRPSMASPLPNETAVDRYVVTDEEFESLQNFDWSCVSSEILNDLEFITKLPMTPVLDYEALGPLLPPKSPDAPCKTLFIDLDETLVHTALGSADSSEEGISSRHDLSFISDTDGSVQARVYFRPWTMDFLKIMSEYYELILYTASVKLYADIIIDELDSEGWISHRLYREHCTQYGESEIYFKDLNGTGRHLKDSVVMDNRLISFGLNISNGIFVSSYTGQQNDTELLHLLPILVALSKQDDVRIALTETYKLPTIVQRYRQDINADVARSLTNIGSPRAHRVDESTSLHTQAISTLGAMNERPPPDMGIAANQQIVETDDERDDDVSETSTEVSIPSSPPEKVDSASATEGDKETLAADSLPAGATRQASSTRHMQGLHKISHNRENIVAAPQVALNLKAERQASLRRLVLPPPAPERKRKQANPFKQLSRIAVTIPRRPVAPRTLY